MTKHTIGVIGGHAISGISKAELFAAMYKGGPVVEQPAPGMVSVIVELMRGLCDTERMEAMQALMDKDLLLVAKSQVIEFRKAPEPPDLTDYLEYNRKTYVTILPGKHRRKMR